MENLDKEIRNHIINVIIGYKKPEKIVIFGSRAADNYGRTSDIDIAIFGKDWLDRDINLIKHKLEEEVKTPLKFDVVNFYRLKKDSLRQNILEKGRLLWKE